MPSLQETFQCTSPVALVTGSGAPRVGRQIASLLAQSGCRIALHANDSAVEAEAAAEQLRRECQVEVMVTQGSLADDAVAPQLIDDVCNRFERLDILVNSAAIWFPTPLEAVTPEEMRRYFDINTVGSFFCARAAGMRMIDQPQGGSIVNIGDWATVRPYLDHAAYFPSKGAIETMTRSLAVELAARNRRIRVNCIQPGPVMFAEDVTESTKAAVAASVLTGMTGTPHHVAHAVKFLCENDFITGVCLPVDGGRSVFAPDGLQMGLNLG
ncbi:MAG: SDR family oxidoreductase [Pirellulales bacterium]|nr:SDR family oxidoreductase [Pirellulales bacterium]